MGIPETRNMHTKPRLPLLAFLLLGFALWVTACGESASPATSTTAAATITSQTVSTTVTVTSQAASTTTTVTFSGASTTTSTAADTSLVTGLTPVVGTFYLVEERHTPARTKVGDLEQIRDEDWLLRYEMSDPRLSGDQDTIINGDQRTDGSAELWGSAVIHNDEGTWECSKWTGTIAEGGLEHYIWAVYKGTGAHAGLVYYQQNHFVEMAGAGKPPGEGVAVTGWIVDTASSVAASTAADTSLVAGLTPVVGTQSLVEEIYTTQGTIVGDIRQIRDEHWVLRNEMSDPRLNGDMDMFINVDQRADGSAEVWGTGVLRNERGSWECSKWTMTIAKGGLEHFGWSVSEGTGAYAGLTVYSQVHFVEIPGVGKPPAEGVAVTGWIQETK